MLNVDITIGGDLRIGVFTNGSDDLTKFDLTFLNLRFIDIKSEEFRSNIRSISRNDHVFSSINFRSLQKMIDEHLPAFALMPIELKDVDEKLIEHVEEAILIINPSYFRLLSVLVYQLEGGDKAFYFCGSEAPRPQYGYHGGIQRPNPIDLSTVDFRLANQFIKLYFDKVKELKYLRHPIRNYVKSFYFANKEGHQLSYTILCISLESLISGRSEIMYKIQRLCAVLNSESIEIGNLIFKNMRFIYDMRSEIVHGENINYKFYEEYWQYLLYLVSRTLIELICSDIKEVKDLNYRVTQFGFGHVKTVTGNPERYIFDKADSHIILKELPKYKPVTG